jgi:tRNA dimethylallyltransferase
MEIGTAKPTVEEQAAARHHLIDVVDPDEPFSLGSWLELAREALEDIWSRGKQPLLVGGTGQYVWALIEGWRVPAVPPQEDLRRELTSRPLADLLSQLRRVDPQAQTFVDPRNVRRVVRALEVYHATGKPFSYWRTKVPPPFDSAVIGKLLPRDELYRRIDERVDTMFATGLIEEVRTLLAMGHSRDLPAMSGIGYREVCAYHAGEVNLRTAIERTKTSTHRFARHQNSWFKPGDARIHWIPANASAVDSAIHDFEGATGVPSV